MCKKFISDACGNLTEVNKWKNKDDEYIFKAINHEKFIYSTDKAIYIKNNVCIKINLLSKKCLEKKINCLFSSIKNDEKYKKIDCSFQKNKNEKNYNKLLDYYVKKFNEFNKTYIFQSVNFSVMDDNYIPFCNMKTANDNNYTSYCLGKIYMTDKYVYNNSILSLENGYSKNKNIISMKCGQSVSAKYGGYIIFGSVLFVLSLIYSLHTEFKYYNMKDINITSLEHTSLEPTLLEHTPIRLDENLMNIVQNITDSEFLEFIEESNDELIYEARVAIKNENTFFLNSAKVYLKDDSSNIITYTKTYTKTNNAFNIVKDTESEFLEKNPNLTKFFNSGIGEELKKNEKLDKFFLILLE